jgi:RNAse (barnase) inhibitor barstar
MLKLTKEQAKDLDTLWDALHIDQGTGRLCEYERAKRSARALPWYMSANTELIDAVIKRAAEHVGV